ncbi:MAG: S-layer homology domain-containing protein, partial [Candidatus Absconditabacteria bacterium]
EGAKFFAQLSKNILTYRMKVNKNCDFKDSYLFDPSLRESIKEVCEYGLMTGTPDGYFLPNKKLTSAEVITILMRAYEGKLDENISPWYANYFLKAREAKITDVGMKMGRLDTVYVNRGQTAVYIYRLGKNIEK